MNDDTGISALQARINGIETDLADLAAAFGDLRSTSPPTFVEDTPSAAPLPQAAPPGEQPATVEPYFSSLMEFVVEHFAPIYARPLSPSLRWCGAWWDHAEAIGRLEALWRSWEVHRLDPQLGMASWLRDHLDPQLHQLLSPSGTFAGCSADRHSSSKALPTHQPPPDVVAELMGPEADTDSQSSRAGGTNARGR